MSDKTSLPNPGTVFIHTSFPNRSYIVSPAKPDEDNSIIFRVDMYGTRSPWGDLLDWNDEIRRGTIKIVYSF